MLSMAVLDGGGLGWAGAHSAGHCASPAGCAAVAGAYLAATTSWGEVMKDTDRLDVSQIRAPFETDRLVVRPEWIDYNGHMNVAFYIKAFDEAFDELYTLLGFDDETIKRTGISTFTAEMHITYQREVREGDRLRIATQLIDFDAKRMHYIQSMYHAEEGFLAATDEWLIMCVDLVRRKSVAIPEPLRRFLGEVKRTHSALMLPPEAGRRISLSGGRPR
jgi:acyl-CoA thioester hydrolase